MSRPQVHQILARVFHEKNSDLLKDCLTHPQFSEFMKVHGIDIPMDELILVFTHTSFSHEFKWAHQEQLEFLGDSVLQLILTEELYRLYPQEKEGRLSKLRSSLVNERALAQLALGLRLDELILVGKGEFKKELYKNEMVLADTFEALLGQVYRHQGFDFIRRLTLSWYERFLPDAFNFEGLLDFDAKSKVQEKSLAKYKKLPRYQSVAVGNQFEIELWVNEKPIAKGIYSSKRNGEKELAHEVIKKGLI